MRRRLHWRPAPPDGRNYLMAERRAAAPRPIKPVIFLVNPPVKDQGNEGSCVFNATATMLEARQGIIDGQYPPVELSRHYAYYKYRERYGSIHADQGASIFEALKTLAGTGICREDLWPYEPDYFARVPSSEADGDAKLHPLGTYYQLESLADMLYCIDEGYGFVGGISVYENFPEIVWPGGWVPMPEGRFEGGHALYFCGYDTHARLMQCQNSWGEWGDAGYPGHGWIPFDYLTPRYSGEFFTVR